MQLTEGIRGPYPRRAIEAADRYLRAIKHRPATVTSAQGFNTSLWQNTIAQYLTPDELEKAIQRGRELRKKHGWKL